jgi:NYN domain
MASQPLSSEDTRKSIAAQRSISKKQVDKPDYWNFSPDDPYKDHSKDKNENHRQISSASARIRAQHKKNQKIIRSRQKYLQAPDKIPTRPPRVVKVEVRNFTIAHNNEIADQEFLDDLVQYFPEDKRFLLSEKPFHGVDTELPVFVFMDFSNIQNSGQKEFFNLGSRLPNGSTDATVLYRRLNLILSRNRNVQLKWIVTSDHQAKCCGQEIKDLEKLEYKIELRHSQKKENRWKEKLVDEGLQEKMTEVLKSHSTPGIVVLVTGDGNVAEYSDGFPPCLEKFLEAGWKAELYSWQRSSSQKWYGLQDKYPELRVESFTRWVRFLFTRRQRCSSPQRNDIVRRLQDTFLDKDKHLAQKPCSQSVPEGHTDLSQSTSPTSSLPSLLPAAAAGAVETSDGESLHLSTPELASSATSSGDESPACTHGQKPNSTHSATGEPYRFTLFSQSFWENYPS